MKFFILHLFLVACTSLNSQNLFFDVGGDVLRVQIKNPYNLNDQTKIDQLVKAINSATELRLLKWEQIKRDSTSVNSDLRQYITQFRPTKNTIVFGGEIVYQLNEGEIAINNNGIVWKAKNLDLVKFLQLYFFGIKNETE